MTTYNNNTDSTLPVAMAVPATAPMSPSSHKHTDYRRNSKVTTNTTTKPSSFTSVTTTATTEQHEIGVATQPPARRSTFNARQMEELQSQGFTRGLAESLQTMKDIFAMRYWIIDNSGSMMTTDGHRIVSTPGIGHSIRTVPCSRWDEIVSCVDYHIQLAGLLELPTKFRLLNPPTATYGGGGHVSQEFSIACGDVMDFDAIQHQVAAATDNMHAIRPSGGTPLTRHINQIYDEIAIMAPQLVTNGQKAVVVIATDGIPTSRYHDARREFVTALRRLEHLPVWVVIRLSTDDDDVVDYYNKLDDELELSLDLLDDFVAEAKEVKGENPFLNYCLPLHRMREMGFHDRTFDMMDERLLSKTELNDFFKILFGEQSMGDVSDPSLDWTGFSADVQRLVQREELQYDPTLRCARPWIDMKKLNRSYNRQRNGLFSCFFA